MNTKMFRRSNSYDPQLRSMSPGPGSNRSGSSSAVMSDDGGPSKSALKSAPRRGGSLYGNLRIPDKVSSELLERALLLEKEVESYKEREDLTLDEATFAHAQEIIFEIQETVMNWRKKGSLDRIKISRTGDTLAVKYRKLFEGQDTRLKDATHDLRSAVQRTADSIRQQKHMDERRLKRRDEMLNGLQLNDGVRGTIVHGLEELSTLDSLETGTHSDRKKSVIVEIQLDNRRRRGSLVAENLMKLYAVFEKVSDVEVESLEQMLSLHDEVSEMLDRVRMYHFTNWGDQLNNLDEPGAQAYFAVHGRKEVVNAAFIRFGCICTLAQWSRCVSFHITACRNVQNLDKDALYMNKEEMVDKLIAIVARAAVCILSLDGSKEEISNELNAMKLCELPLDDFRPQLAELLSAMEVLGEDTFSIAAREMLVLRKDRPAIRYRRAPVVASILEKTLKMVRFLIAIGRDQGLLPLCTKELEQMYQEARDIQKTEGAAPIRVKVDLKGLTNTIDDEIDITELQQINKRLADLKVREIKDPLVSPEDRMRKLQKISLDEDVLVEMDRVVAQSISDKQLNKPANGQQKKELTRGSNTGVSRLKYFQNKARVKSHCDSSDKFRNSDISFRSPPLRGLSMPPRRRSTGSYSFYKNLH